MSESTVSPEPRNDPPTLAATSPDRDPDGVSGPASKPGVIAGMLGEGADARHVALVILAALAVLYTLYFARSLFLPIVVAILLDFLLRPVVRGLKRLHIPEAIGAGLVIVGALGLLAGGVYGLSGPASQWVARAPESFDLVQQKLQRLRKPVERVTEAAEQVETATDVDNKTLEVQVKGPGLMSHVFGGTTAAIGAILTVVFLAYLLLAAGDLFLQKLVGVLPQFSDKRKAVAIARDTETQVSNYLFTTTLINIGVGVVTGVVVLLLGMPNPVLWGVIAGVLNFVLYIGALVNLVILALAALLAFESIGQALTIPAAFLAINLVEANVVSPLILGRRLRLNPVGLFVGLVFWFYVWGILGAILAVPIMATLKITCDHIESLQPLGEFLGE